MLCGLGTLVLVQNHGWQVWQVSTLLVVSSMLSMLAAPLLGYCVDRFGERVTTPASYAGLALCCVGFAILSNAWLLAGLWVAIKLLLTLGLGLSTYVGRIAPREELTPTLSAGVSINHISSVLMPMLSGLLMPIISFSGVFLLTAGILLASVPFARALRTGAEHAAPAGAEPGQARIPIHGRHSNHLDQSARCTGHADVGVGVGDGVRAVIEGALVSGASMPSAVTRNRERPMAMSTCSPCQKLSPATLSEVVESREPENASWPIPPIIEDIGQHISALLDKDGPEGRRDTPYCGTLPASSMIVVSCPRIHGCETLRAFRSPCRSR